MTATSITAQTEHSRNPASREDSAVSVSSEDGQVGTSRPRFLVVGDSSRIEPALRSVFDTAYDLVRIGSVEEALRTLGTQGADVVLLDNALTVTDSQSAEHRCEHEPQPVVWMAVDPKAVKMLGSLLKRMAGPSPRPQGVASPRGTAKCD